MDFKAGIGFYGFVMFVRAIFSWVFFVVCAGAYAGPAGGERLVQRLKLPPSEEEKFAQELSTLSREEYEFVLELMALPSEEEKVQKIQILRSGALARHGQPAAPRSDFNWRRVLEHLLFADLTPQVYTAVLDLVEEFYWGTLPLQKGLLVRVRGQYSSAVVKTRILELLQKTPVHKELYPLLKDTLQDPGRAIYVRKGVLILLGSLPHPPEDFQEILGRVMQGASHKFAGSEVNNLFFLKSAAARFMYHIKDADLFISVLQTALSTPNNYVKDAALMSLEQNPPPFEDHYNHPQLQKVLATRVRQEANTHLHEIIFAILDKATRWDPSVEGAMAHIIQGSHYSFTTRRQALHFLPRMSFDTQVVLARYILLESVGNKMTDALLSVWDSMPPDPESLYTHTPTLKILGEKVFFTTIKVGLKLKMLDLLLKAHFVSDILVADSGFEMHTVRFMNPPGANPYLMEGLIPFIPYFKSPVNQKSAVLAALKSDNSYVSGRMLRVLTRPVVDPVFARVYNDVDIQKRMVAAAFFENSYSVAQQLAIRALRHVSEPHAEVVAVLNKAKTHHQDLHKRETAADILKKLHAAPPPLRVQACKDTLS